MQHPRERGQHRKGDEERVVGLSLLDRSHDEGADDADADEGGDAADAREHGGGELAAPRHDEARQHGERAGEARSLGAEDRVRGLRLALDVAEEVGGGRRRRLLDVPSGGHRDLLGLGPHQPAVGTVVLDELLVRAAFDDPAVLEDQDAVGTDHAREAVRQDERGAAGHQAIEGFLDDGLVLGVDRGEGLVEDQDRSVAQERSRDRQALALAARELGPALADEGGIARRQGLDEGMGVGRARRGLDLGVLGVGLAEPQVLLDRAMEKRGVLLHEGDLSAHGLGIERAQVVAADPDRTRLRIVEPEEEARDRGFAGAARADDADAFPGRYREGEAVMGGTAGTGIGEADVLEGEGRLYRRRPGARRVLHRCLGFEEGGDAEGRRLPHHALVQDRPQVPERAENLGPGHEHDEEGAEAHEPVRHAIGTHAEGHGSSDRDGHVGDAAGHGAGRQHPHGAVRELARFLRQHAAVGGTLAEGLERRQTLDGIEELGTEGLERPLARQARAPVETVEEHGQEEAEEGCRDHDACYRQVPPGDDGEDREWGQACDAELRQILPEEGLQLLDPVDDREHDPAGALAREPGGAEGGYLVVEGGAQVLLDPCGRAVCCHGAEMLEGPAQQDRGRDRRRGKGQGRRWRTRDDARQQPAEEDEARDPHTGGNEAGQDLDGELYPHAAHHVPETLVEIHRPPVLARGFEIA